MTTLIEESLAHYAEHHGDPYEAAFKKLYAADPSYQALFFSIRMKGCAAI